MLDIETLLRPAHTLSVTEQRALCEKILRLNLRLSTEPAFVANWNARIGGFLTNLDVLDLVWDGDELVGHYGYRTLLVDGRTVLYVDNFTVAPGLQASGIGKRVAMRFALRALVAARGGEVLVASRTSNPHIAAGLWRAFADPSLTYPCFDPARGSSARLSRVAKAVAAQLWPALSFDSSAGVLVGAYGGSFIPVAPTTCLEVARHFDAHVCASRGDAVLQIINFSPAAWWPLARYFAKGRVRTWWSRHLRRRTSRQTASAS